LDPSSTIIWANSGTAMTPSLIWFPMRRFTLVFQQCPPLEGNLNKPHVLYQVRLWTRDKDNLEMFIKSNHSPVPEKFVDFIIKNFCINPILPTADQIVSS
jgi:hypothetical protein